MKWIRSVGFALEGLWTALSEQKNLRIHAVALLLACAAGYYYGITAVEWCVVLLASGLVIGLELVNSAIEELTDLVTRERNPQAKKAKDIAAAAVLVASVVALAVGIIIFGKYIFAQ